jgi:hypothetical protein
MVILEHYAVSSFFFLSFVLIADGGPHVNEAESPRFAEHVTDANKHERIALSIH